MDERKFSSQWKEEKKMKSLNCVSQEFSEENSADKNERVDDINSVVVQEISNDSTSKTPDGSNISSGNILKPEECCPVYKCNKLSSVFVDAGSDFVETDYLLEEDDNICKVNSETLCSDHKNVDYNLVKSVKIEQNIEVSGKQNEIIQNFDAAVFSISDICTSNDRPGVSTNASIENMYENSDECDKKPYICLDYSKTTKVVSVFGAFEKMNTNVEEGKGAEGELVDHTTQNIHPKIKEETVNEEEVSIINESVIDIELHPMNKIEELSDISENNIPVLDRSCSGYTAIFGEEYVEKLCLADENMKMTSKIDKTCQNQRNWKFKHATERHYFCEVCSKGFIHLHNLNVHKRFHTTDKLFGCNICGKAFTQLGHLTKHKHIDTGDRPYDCDICGKSFTQQVSLKKHKLKHTSDSTYGCDVCGKTFTQLGHLKKHKHIHTGGRPYCCDMCGKLLTKQSSLTAHKRIHTGDRPFVCTICGKTFTQKAHLKCHKIIHTGDRPFHCSTCGKAFTHVSNLKKHKLIHTGDRPYGCDICGKSFTQQVSLTKHKRIHTC